MSAEGRGTYLGADDALDDAWGDDRDSEPCSHCSGEPEMQECDDPIQCCSPRCDGYWHPCEACQGTGLAKHQVASPARRTPSACTGVGLEQAARPPSLPAFSRIGCLAMSAHALAVTAIIAADIIGSAVILAFRVRADRKRSAEHERAREQDDMRLAA